MERAKDLNGLLTILREATHAVGQVIPVLDERQDTASRARLGEIRDSLEYVGRDLAGGVIDLRELPFNERTWNLLFIEPVIPLASEEEEASDV